MCIPETLHSNSFQRYGPPQGQISAPTFGNPAPTFRSRKISGRPLWLKITMTLMSRQSSDFKPLISSVQLEEKADRLKFFWCHEFPRGRTVWKPLLKLLLLERLETFVMVPAAAVHNCCCPVLFIFSVSLSLSFFLTWSLFLHMVHFCPKACQHTEVYIM